MIGSSNCKDYVVIFVYDENGNPDLPTTARGLVEDVLNIEPVFIKLGNRHNLREVLDGVYEKGQIPVVFLEEIFPDMFPRGMSFPDKEVCDLLLEFDQGGVLFPLFGEEDELLRYMRSKESSWVVPEGRKGFSEHVLGIPEYVDCYKEMRRGVGFCEEECL